MTGKDIKIQSPLFFVLLLAGFLFRLYLSSLFPHIPLFDEGGYLKFAKSMTDGFWAADCCQYTYGYPLFLILIFKIFGNNNLSALVFFQGLLDTFTAVLLYLISRKIMINRNFAYMTLLIYLFNPLTASYTGLYLSEIWGIFLLVLTVYLFVTAETKKRYLSAGITLGLFTFTRIMFFWWSAALMFIFLFFALIKKRSLINPALFLISGFILTAIYPSVANFRIYKTAMPLPPVSTVGLSFYKSFEISNWPSLLTENYTETGGKVIEITDFPDNRSLQNFLKPKIEERLRLAALNPGQFALSRLKIIGSFWNKSNLYYYTDPFFPSDRPAVITGNLIFLLFSGWGLIRFLKNCKREKEYGLFIIMFTMVLYLTIPLSLLVPEERLTLPAYPILALFAPLGVYYLRNLSRNRS